MIVILKQNSDKERVDRLMQHFKDMGLTIHYSQGENTTIFGLVGDTTKLDEGDIMAYDVVERVQRVTANSTMRIRSLRLRGAGSARDTST